MKQVKCNNLTHIMILIVAGFFILIVIASLFFNFRLLNSSSDNSPEAINTQQTIPTLDPKHLLTYAGWIPYWGSNDGLESTKAHKSILDTISPVWYEVNANGSLLKRFPGNKTELSNFVKANNIALIPTISLFDHELFTVILQNPMNLERHITEIISEVNNNNYAGIDIDYESTKLADKEQYFLLLSRLSGQLHQKGKKLIVTVIAKWGDDIVYPSLPETRQVQDWTRIGSLADEVRIMAYDYTYAKSYFPGPIAPVIWIQDVLEYALTKLPPEKIILGIHMYSYEWSLNNSQNQLDFIIDYLANSQSDKSARSFDYQTVKSILQDNTGQNSTYQGENIFRYEKAINGKQEKRVLVYITPEGIKQRIDLAKTFKIKGVVFWRLGNDADLLPEN